MNSQPSTCTECGATNDAATTCRDCFDAMLAFENEHPPVFGAAHHLTVACYYLQHPTGYTTDALNAWHSGIADSLDGRLTPKELQRRSRRQFDGATRVRDPLAAVPDWWPKTWHATVCSVLRPDEVISETAYIDRARQWATHVRATLDAAAKLER
jgi:hypothetical protein